MHNPAAQNIDLDEVVREASSKNRLDPDFVSSVIKAESNFKTHAVSKKGALGLMQLMPSTAAQLGVADPFDPKANVEAGTAHLSALLDRYNNDPIKALAAYNAGAHRVKQYNGVPPYRETRAYINKIVRDFNAKKRAQMKAAAADEDRDTGKECKYKARKESFAADGERTESGQPRIAFRNTLKAPRPASRALFLYRFFLYDQPSAKFMSKKRFLITALVLVVLGGLVYLQVRAWKKFDWHRFWAATHNTNKFYLVSGVALVYADYILRALRWKIMLRPVCDAKTSDLVAPTMIGFAGLALLGRPGEFIRPYLIARKTTLSMASQLAVWTVERIFDSGAFALIMAVNILWSREHP